MILTNMNPLIKKIISVYLLYFLITSSCFTQEENKSLYSKSPNEYNLELFPEKISLIRDDSIQLNSYFMEFLELNPDELDLEFMQRTLIEGLSSFNNLNKQNKLGIEELYEKYRIRLHQFRSHSQELLLKKYMIHTDQENR